ncbi:hypothetical protein NHB34_01650 [Polynucleobacter sp. MWH-UH19D]|uniref:hypothetical protein n=1 Tax=Polynucleobacter sp. MWH-UH19D TaxID=1855610 RepID=UPI003364EB76
MKKLNNKFIYISSVCVVALSVAITCYMARLLRPAADDYCYGSISAEFGFIGGIGYWFDTWSGFLLSVFTGSLFVGIPLALFPYGLASAIPFISAALGMGIIVNLIDQNIAANSREKLTTVIFLAFGWWTYLWATPAINHYLHYSVLLANGLTFWQTLNGQYVIQLQILIAAIVITPRVFKNSPLLLMTSGLIIGLVSGTAGTTLSLSLLLIGLVLIAAARFFKSEALCVTGNFWMPLCIGLLVGVIACHIFVPGSLIRMRALNIQVEMTWTSLTSMVKMSVFDGTLKWMKSYFNYGAVLFGFLTYGFYFLRGFSSYALSSKNILSLSLFFSIFAYLQCLVNRLAQFFSYEAYWHFVSPTICIFISIYFFGIWGALVTRSVSLINPFKRLLIIFYVLLLLLSLYVNIFMWSKIQNRYDLWISGPAPAEGVSDIEDRNGWQMQCWNKLMDLRGESNSR